MKIQQVIRQVVQLAALVVFTYQMVLAFGKYITFSTTAVTEIKDIKDAILPSIFVCPKAFDVDDRLEHNKCSFIQNVLCLAFTCHSRDQCGYAYDYTYYSSCILSLLQD